ncbi:L-alanine-DL-glutamate epimerase [Thermosipho melanesiensis]|uniref:Dipeptide epimerase n=2 Tax=Thermosipho melanesiensis TaxID=46541 RepID=A6LL23_THEM4|nr:L-Ala-D/L-Glu epimerase [Thermosipho melanesiensis]ABR30624.1 Mandelate racemase/muconate lactonizing enzyme, C-terminal domain protein [Thermosipho melanesiensis BI429]APT73764.1 L-alanine-DL-glutamate epimerase [Thermosipho melanesiensis]OOC35704.1 L-alanine-DL-glutamate epimerase [Thermosipho melanesiensis]OOC39003.1 L-alanine-DL-glutamate epimerase [Thermosipho melanesiensis]OOC39151.1 L-alanine-DL-glutamate epimerase [Thermosipho melanesiensis]
MGKIKTVKFKLNTFEYEKPFHITGSVSDKVNNVEVIIELENGILGYGEASPSFRVNGERFETLLSLEPIVNEMIKGKEVRNYRQIFDIIDRFFSFPSIKAAVQYAVLDAFSEEIGIPVYQLLGGSEEKIETDKTIGISSLDERILDAKKFFEEGFRTIKIKVGEDLKEDIEAIEAIYEITKGAKYIVDANMGYTPKQAVTFVNEIYKKGIDIHVFEQPVQRYDIEGLKFVRFKSPFPVSADESARTKHDVMRLIKEEAIDYVNIKLMKSGISDALSIVEIVKAANLRLMIGCMGESSLGINQSVHFALGTGAFDFHDLDSSLMLKEKEFRGKYKIQKPYYVAI